MSNPASKLRLPISCSASAPSIPCNSVLVQAPAGSGKTDLLTRRFLRLLAEVDEPGQIVAITFTKAAAAEMRHRILHELERAAARTDAAPDPDAFSMEPLAQRALAHSKSLGWNLLDQPAQLRISTIDSFCREIALQQPLLSGLGDGLGIYEQPDELYRRAARRTLQQIDAAEAGAGDPALTAAIEFAPAVARQQLAGDGRPPRRDASAARPLDARLRPRSRSGLGCTARTPRTPLRKSHRRTLSPQSANSSTRSPASAKKLWRWPALPANREPARSSRHSPSSPTSLPAVGVERRL